MLIYTASRVYTAGSPCPIYQTSKQHNINDALTDAQLVSVTVVIILTVPAIEMMVLPYLTR